MTYTVSSGTLNPTIPYHTTRRAAIMWPAGCALCTLSTPSIPKGSDLGDLWDMWPDLEWLWKSGLVKQKGKITRDCK